MQPDQSSSPSDLFFFLGGHDLEMLTIRALLDEHASGRYADANLSWGATTSAYRSSIDQVLASGQTPVLIELEDDLALPLERVLVIDHHGRRAGSDRATSLEQVFELLRLPPEAWTRRHALVAANDRAYLEGLADLGATVTEIQAVRSEDRRAQGITEADETAAAEALQHLESRCQGRLLLASLPHARTASLVDRLAPEAGGEGFETLFVSSPNEANIFAPGWLIEQLAARFSSGWYGGNLPKSGYFGIQGDPEAVAEVVEALVEEKISQDAVGR